MSERILFRGGTIVDPLRREPYVGDLRTDGGIVGSAAGSLEEKPGDEVFDARGKLIFPGLVDIHVHVSHCPDGRHMLAKAGVTTALDTAGLPEEMTDGLLKSGAGLTVGWLYPLTPGGTVSGPNPSEKELRKVISEAAENGALGVKVLGGHYPLTRDATRLAVEIAHESRLWVAVHAGTVETPGDIRGFEELVELAGDLPVHLAHVNSFCRGAGENSPLDEAKRALDALKTVPKCRSESYLAMINGTSGECINGKPKSEVTGRCLLKGGFSADLEGMKNAILSGWAKIHFHDTVRREVVFPDPEAALKFYLDRETRVMASFAVNSPVSAIPIALAKDADGKFLVDALATDGGAIPRNVTLRQGLCLVNFGAMTLNELALKACLTPARLLGLDKKGSLSEGFDADITMVNPATSEVETVVCGGRVIVREGRVVGDGGRFICSDRGLGYFRKKSIRADAVRPPWLDA